MGGFSFCVGVRIYAAIRSEALKRFLAALRGCFLCGVVFGVLRFACAMLCKAQILPVLRFLLFFEYLYIFLFSFVVARFWGIVGGCYILPYFDSITTIF